jgi:hypothetical protein
MNTPHVTLAAREDAGIFTGWVVAPGATGER